MLKHNSGLFISMIQQSQIFQIFSVIFLVISLAQHLAEVEVE